MSDQQSSIGSGAKFKGKISGAKALEINGDVEADIDICLLYTSPSPRD